MGEASGDDDSSYPFSVTTPQPPPPPPPKKLSVLPLIALIFYNVSGGPFGVEDSVSAGGGPLLSLLGFLVFPFLWSLPEALVTAELAASFPENGGYVLWISSAFGPFWGFQEGFWKWASGTMDNALYPVLFLDYLCQSLPFFARPAARTPALLVLTAGLTFLNYRGLNIVGLAAVALTAFSLSPFVVMALLALPRLRPRRWLAVDLKRANFRGYFNIMFWNLNYWDKASTLAGEVEDPSRSFPKALFGAVILVMASYLIPLLAGTGAMDASITEEWKDGYFAQVGMVIGGAWLRWWIQAAAAMSNMGLFEAEMSSDSFQLLGMSEMGMLPAIFAERNIEREKERERNGVFQPCFSFGRLCFGLSHGLHRRSTEHPARRCGRPQLRPGRRRRRSCVMGRRHRLLRSEVRQQARHRLSARALRRALRGEPLLGHRQRLHPDRRRQHLDCGEAVLRLRKQLLRRRSGMQTLHAGRVAEHYGHRLR
nr:PREDICTED: probable polyamine transporter At3g19553 isoform X2 [Musa acuminata subsp. malaccensis]